MGEQKKNFNLKSCKHVVIIVLAVVMLVIVMSVIFKFNNREEAPKIITKSTLEKIINVSDLSTFEAVYNGVAKVMNEKKPENVDYYVYYEAKVKAGIDFEQVDINVNDEEKIITVDIPEIKITDINVDISSLDFIWENDKANTETVTEEAYKKCIEDVTNESNTEDAIYELAEKNAKNIVEALIKPFINQVDSEYQLKIN